jgi:hypothetical protein
VSRHVAVTLTVQCTALSVMAPVFSWSATTDLGCLVPAHRTALAPLGGGPAPPHRPVFYP